jgi:antitoxin component YwqK of YwqJK toxin-antitoxin module
MNRIQLYICTGLTLALLLTPPAAGQEEPGSAQEEKETLVISSMQKVPDFSKHVMKKVFQKLPEDYKVEITIGQYFDQGHSSSSGLMEPVVSSYVPVNPEGERDGLQVFLKGRGRTYRTVEWKDGVKHGKEKFYSPNPRYVTTEMEWKKGRLQGLRKTFYPDGEVRSVTPYVAGEPHGLAKTFDRKGDLLSKTHNKKGQRHGEAIEYFPGTDQPQRIVPYVEGEAQGTARFYYQDGSLKKELGLKDDLFHGVEKQYDPDGTVIRTIYWWEGDKISEAEYRSLSKKTDK